MAGDEVMEQFKAAMGSVKRLFDREEYEQALPICAKALDLQPDSDFIRRCKVFALLNLSRWSEGLQVCEKARGEESFAFEKGYCLYRLNRFQEALDALKADEVSDRRSRLEAQVRYRMGDYSTCAQMYEKVYDDDREDVLALVNAVASHVSGDKPREAIRFTQNQEELLESSYELCFNLACALIDVGRLSDAEARLQQAKEICMAELREEEEEEDAQLEDHQEMAAINVQQGCVLQRQGKLEEANDLYNRVLKQRPGQEGQVDITVLAVACNNVVSLRPEGKSLFDSLKRINIASKESLEHKLTRKQNLEISINKCLLLLQAKKPDEAKRELQRIKETFPDHPRGAIVQAAFAHMEKKPKVCEEALQGYLNDHPGNEEVLLAVAQLHASSNRLDKAVEALAQLPVSRRAMPRIAEALVALYQRQKSPEKAVTTLREAIGHWSKGKEADEDTLSEVLRISSRLATQLKDQAFAAEVYQAYLEQIDGGDVQALCGLVKALSATDPEKAEQYAMRLRVPEYDHLDAEELENAPIPKLASVLKKGKEKETAKDSAADGETTATEGAEKAAPEKKKQKRRRKVRYPKNYDPENPGPAPDPERWLPKHERAEFKKKMRKRDKNMLRGPQGAMSLDDMAFRKAGPSTAQMEVASEKKPAASKGRNKKGKK